MEDIFKESARQVPALVIVVVLCILFAKSGAIVIKSFLSQQTESRSEYIKTIERFHSENMEARNQNRQTIHENSQAGDRQTQALHELTNEVRELRGSLSAAVKRFGGA